MAWSRASTKTKANRKKYEKDRNDNHTRRQADRDDMNGGRSKKNPKGKDICHKGSGGKGEAYYCDRSKNRAEGGAKGGRKSRGGGRPKGS